MHSRWLAYLCVCVCVCVSVSVYVCVSVRSQEHETPDDIYIDELLDLSTDEERAKRLQVGESYFEVELLPSRHTHRTGEPLLSTQTILCTHRYL